MYNVEIKPRRRPWTEEEKSRALKECAGRCACCGKKLNMKTLTMEHVVPISKGGDNVPENLIVLCKNCNSSKSNKLYWPLGFYMALNSGKIHDVHKYFMNWCNDNINKEYLFEKPFIAEGYSMYMYADHKLRDLKNGVVVPSLILDFYEISYEESAAILRNIEVKKTEIYNSVLHADLPFSLFGAKVRVSDSFSGLYTIQFDENLNVIIVSEVFCRNPKLTEMLSASILEYMSTIWVKYDIDGVVIRSYTDKTAKYLSNEFFNKSLNTGVPYCVLPTDKFSYSGKEESVYKENEVFIKLKTNKDFVLDEIECNVKSAFRQKLNK